MRATTSPQQSPGPARPRQFDWTTVAIFAVVLLAVAVVAAVIFQRAADEEAERERRADEFIRSARLQQAPRNDGDSRPGPTYRMIDEDGNAYEIPEDSVTIARDRYSRRFESIAEKERWEDSQRRATEAREREERSAAAAGEARDVARIQAALKRSGLEGTGWWCPINDRDYPAIAVGGQCARSAKACRAAQEKQHLSRPCGAQPRAACYVFHRVLHDRDEVACFASFEECTADRGQRISPVPTAPLGMQPMQLESSDFREISECRPVK